MSASESSMPGGQPSMTQPIAGPWDSPKLVTANRAPKVLPLMAGIFRTVSHPLFRERAGAEDWRIIPERSQLRPGHLLFAGGPVADVGFQHPVLEALAFHHGASHVVEADHTHQRAAFQHRH